MRSDKETVLDLFGHPKTGQNFDRKQTEKELIEIINTKNEEITILHQVNSRLAYQLSILQKKLGIDPDVVLKELEKIGDFSVAYHTDLGLLRYLDHLLLAYDETILKQKKIIAMLYSQLEDADKKAEAIIREKEYLLEENKNKCKKILQIYTQGHPDQNLSAAYSTHQDSLGKLSRDIQNEKNLLTKEQSQHILDAYHQLEAKFEEMQLQLAEEKQNAQKYYQTYKRQSEELKETLINVDSLLKAKDFLQKTLNKANEENITLENTKTQLQTRIAKLQSELKSLRSQLFNQKKIAREDIERASIETDSMKSELSNATKRQKQTFNKLMLVEKQLETAKDTLRSLRRQNQKVKSDFQNTLKMCEAYESKIATLTRRDENIREIVDQSKQKLQAVLLEKDKALLKVQQLQKIMDNMNERHRQQLSKQRENYQRMLTEFQQKMRIISEEKEECESIFMETELGYKNQLEKLKRQNSILHEENIKFVENIRMSTGSEIISKLKEYQSKNDSLTKILNQKERALKEQESKHEEAVHEYQGEVRNLNRLLEKEKGLTTQYMKELTQERSRLSIISNQRECLENEIKRLKKNYEFKNVQLNDEREYRIAELEGKLSESIKKEKETRARAIEMLEKYDEAEQKLKSQYQKRIVELETENERIKKKLAKLRT